MSFSAAALGLAVDNFKVFPCWPSDKAPLTANGFHAGTTEVEAVDSWWRRWPDANVGIVTGHGFVVVDIDMKAGVDGEVAWTALQAEHGRAPVTRTVLTPSGGRHLYFGTNGETIPNSASQLGLGIDIRGDGGYVIAAGVVDGRPYETLAVPMAPAPDWLLHLLRDQNAPGERPRFESAADQISAGGRNHYLMQYGGRLCSLGLSVDEVRVLVLAENERVCAPPLNADEIESTVMKSARRYELEQSTRGRVLNAFDLLPSGEPVAIQDTADLLDAVRAVLARYLVLPGQHFYDAVSLWVLHTHAVTAGDTTARLVFKSPEKESGKTRALEVLELLVPAPLSVFNVSTAGIYRLLKEQQATVLLDECDAIFSPKAGNYEDLRALLNAGYRRGATVGRMVGEGGKMHLERFPVFASVALAAIGDLPDTIESRAVIVPMRRRAPSETVEKFRHRHVVKEHSQLRQKLAAWAVVALETLAGANPTMPDSLEDRSEDVWEPLIAIADIASDEWAERARQAAVVVVKGRVAEDASIGVRLLADLRLVMDSHERMSSAGICAALNAIDESGWGGWSDGKGINPRDLARRLKLRHRLEECAATGWHCAKGLPPRGLPRHLDALPPGYIRYRRYKRYTNSNSCSGCSGCSGHYGGSG